MPQIFAPRRGRVAAPVSNGMATDGTMVVTSNNGATERTALGMPHRSALDDAAGCLDRLDNRVAAGSSKTIEIKTNRPFSPDALVVSSDVAEFFDILNINNGEDQLLPKSEDIAIPASGFSEVSTANPMYFFEPGLTIQTDVGMKITVRNRTAEIQEFRAVLQGTQFRQAT